MKIKSVFINNGVIPLKYTADGDNINPPLEINGISKGAKSMILIVDDPDAERVVGFIWNHWIRFNIPISGDSINIDENSEPGIGGFSSYKSGKYGGPNPPAGTGVHNYYFKIYALDIELDLDNSANKSDIQNAMRGHILDSAELIGTYERK
jgi:Raf kinase inhibitor-like YbhB/YbcL family protein